MGLGVSKSRLERRNSVLRRSQRKFVHSVKQKTDKLLKDIRKFKGTEEDTAYVELKAKIETIERELRVQSKNLQPQVKVIHDEAVKQIGECYQALDDKLKENQALQTPAQEEVVAEVNADNDYDDVFIEETNLEEATNKRKTVELKLIQVAPIEASPQMNKRFSAVKIGVPVMPGSMMESLQRRTLKAEERVAQIRQEIEKVEEEISQFVGRKHGKHYNMIKGKLEGYSNDLHMIPTSDDAVAEQTKMCANYIASCVSFLDEKAVDGDQEDEEVKPSAEENLSPRTMRTTYI